MSRRYDWSLRTLVSLLCGITKIGSTTIAETTEYQACLNSQCSSLDLGTRSLTGSIPNSMVNLTSLTQLDLQNNRLTGTMPTELGASTVLAYLYMHTNSLTGTVPTELGALTALTYLYMHTNSLTGTLPTELGALTALTYLHGGEASEEEAVSDTGDAAATAKAALAWLCSGGSP
ncbi:hypothetical protein CYMTET_36013 [Cymbomonas tetramitiformis]|uniref:L domain-like protein n=1 Tax=Cymbomonas tetramitiformis TaxID=36881 RepID=A0AAE0F830_9CHLO|nr:hypothetical protein CYMTET_36013 [Cymbomonas tetramitiformis]